MSTFVIIGASMIGLVLWARGDADRLRATPASVTSFVGLHDLARTDPVVVVVDRTLTRHRTHRYHGGAAGVVVAYVVAISRPQGFSFGVGIGPSLFPDTLLCIVAGVLLGVISAESHHLRARPAGERRIASLEPRSPVAAVDRRGTVGRLVGAVFAVVLAAGGTVAHPSIVRTCAVLVVVVTALVAWQQPRIARRSRPLLPAELADADLALRRAGSAAVDDAGSGLVLLLLANAVTSSTTRTDLPVTLVSIALLVGAIVCWRRSRVWVVRVSPGPEVAAA